jgi:hypothetical protein
MSSVQCQRQNPLVIRVIKTARAGLKFLSVLAAVLDFEVAGEIAALLAAFEIEPPV